MAATNTAATESTPAASAATSMEVVPAETAATGVPPIVAEPPFVVAGVPAVVDVVAPTVVQTATAITAATATPMSITAVDGEETKAAVLVTAPIKTEGVVGGEEGGALSDSELVSLMRPVMDQSRRIDVGAAHVHEYVRQRLFLNYPQHRHSLHPERIAAICAKVRTSDGLVKKIGAVGREQGQSEEGECVCVCVCVLGG